MIQASQFMLDGALGKPLPRPDRIFTSGTFAPDMPSPTVPIDYPRTGEVGGPDPRFFQYPVAWNLPTGPRVYEPISFDMLRSIAHDVDAVRSAIQLLKDEIVAVPFTIKVKDPDRARQMGHDWLRDERIQIANFFERPDPHQGLEIDDWLKLILEEVLTTDALSLYPLRTLAKDGATPPGGAIKTDLVALQIIDGATIKPLIDLRGGRPLPPYPAFQQYLYGVPRSEFTAHAAQGMLPTEYDPNANMDFTTEQIIYKPYTRRANSVYGFPPVEQVVFTAITYLRRETWWQSYFNESDLPAMFLVGGQDWSVDQLERWEQALHSLLAGDPSFRWRVKAIPYGSKVEQIKQPNFDVSFDEYLLKVIAMIFRLTTSELFGMSSKSGLGGRGFLEEQAQVQDRKAVWPYRRWLERLLTRVITLDFHQPDLCFEFDDKSLADASKQAQIDDLYIKNGTRAIREIRDDHGWGDLGLEQADEPYIETRTGIIPLHMLGQVEQALLEQAKTPGNDDDIGVASQAPKRPTSPAKMLLNDQMDELADFKKFLTKDIAKERPFVFRKVPADLGRSLNAAVRGWLQGPGE